MRSFLHGFRLLLKTPGVSLTAIFTLAVGIGANTAIFSVANSVLLSPLPFAHPDRLVLVSAAQTNDRTQLGVFSWPRFEFIRDHARSYEGIAGFAPEGFTLTGAADAEQVRAARVGWNFFDILGVRPEHGRSFRPDEDKPGAPLAVMLSHSLWVRRFASDPLIEGKLIQLNGASYTVAGVVPEGFQFQPLGTPVDIWAPRIFDLNLLTPPQLQSGAGFITAVARLRSGATPGTAEAEMRVVDSDYRREKAALVDSDPRLMVITPSLEEQLVSNIRPALLVLIGAVGFVLLIACANVAGLLLSRAAERKREIAIRIALGAGRPVVLRQLLAESLALALVSGFAGIVLSQWATRGLIALASTTFPEVERVRTDAVTLAFAATITLLSGILFGLIPAWQTSRTGIEGVLRAEGGRSIGGRNRHFVRNVLIVSQLALSIVLLTGAGLLVRSFIQLRSTNTGIDSRSLLTMRVNLAQSRYGTAAKQTAYYQQVLDSFASVPGVASVAVSSALPASPFRFSPVLIEGQPAVPISQRPILNIQMVSPDYARTFGIAVTAGRTFTARDDAAGPPELLVNEALVRRYWPGQNAIGKKLLVGRTAPGEVVGVLRDVKNNGLNTEPTPEVFIPFAQKPWAILNITVRTIPKPKTLIPALRSRLNAIDRDQPATAVQTVDELLDSVSGQPRLMMVLMTVFSACAMLIAAVGLYGVIAYSVSRRTREIGVRSALGASAGDITRVVLREAAMLAGLGIAAGGAAAYFLAKLISSQLYRTPPSDPWSFAASAVVFGSVALVASYLPARRAARLDPLVALQSE